MLQPRTGVVALCLVAATACAPSAGPSAQPPASAQPSAPSEQSDGQAKANAKLPENLQFTANLVGGGQLEGGELRGRDVVLWFWAPW